MAPEMTWRAGAKPKKSPTTRETPVVANPLAWGIHEVLVDVDAYRIERAAIATAIDWTVDPRSAQVLIVLSGALTVHGGGEMVEMACGDCVILPAAIGAVEAVPGDDGALCVLAGAGGVAMLG